MIEPHHSLMSAPDLTDAESICPLWARLAGGSNYIALDSRAHEHLQLYGRH